MKTNIFTKTFEFEEFGEVYQVVFTLTPYDNDNLIVCGTTMFRGKVINAVLKERHKVGEIAYRSPQQTFQEMDLTEAKLFWSNIISTLIKELDKIDSGSKIVKN